MIKDKFFLIALNRQLEDEAGIQFVAFSDYGYIRRNRALPDEENSVGMISAGAGLRLTMTDHFQMRFDWGFPFEQTTETGTGSNGRGHLVMQLQF